MLETDEIVSHSQRRGFIDPSAELYGGTGTFGVTGPSAPWSITTDNRDFHSSGSEGLCGIVVRASNVFSATGERVELTHFPILTKNSNRGVACDSYAGAVWNPGHVGGSDDRLS